MISDNSWYIAIHFDRLNEELLETTFGKSDDDEKLSNLERRLVNRVITKEEFDKMKVDLKLSES